MWALLALGVLWLIFHFMTADRYMDGGGTPSSELSDYVQQKSPPSGGLVDIPEPPGGKRDPEVEALLRKGDFKEARRLLQMRMDDATCAPIGRDAAIARVTHYLMLLEDD